MQLEAIHSADLIRQVEVYAAVHDTSINAVVEQLLEQLVSRQNAVS